MSEALHLQQACRPMTTSLGSTPAVLVAPESAAEDIRNALAILAVTDMEPLNKAAIAVRLNRAIAKIEDRQLA